MGGIILIFLYITTQSYYSMTLHSEVRTSTLHPYKSRRDITILQVEIPEETTIAAFKFFAEEAKSECKPSKVLLYMKHKSFPVVNPDNSKFPPTFKNTSRLNTYHMELKSNAVDYLLHLLYPDPGYYYIAAFLPYVDPKYDTIQPPDLARKCEPSFHTELKVLRHNVEPIISDIFYGVNTIANYSVLYKFYVPHLVTHATVFIGDVKFSDTASQLVVKVRIGAIPSESSYTKRVSIRSNSTTIPIEVREDAWHFICFLFEDSVSNSSLSSFGFVVKYFSTVSPNSWRLYSSAHITRQIPYRQYNLVQESSADAFSYSFGIHPGNKTVNLTNNGFVVLRFHLKEHSDIGGVLTFKLSFKTKSRRHKIVACIRPEAAELPIWPHLCKYKRAIKAPLILNATTDKDSVTIPYPESGVWYVSLRLFCGRCTHCMCPIYCQNVFESCVSQCQLSCSGGSCNSCLQNCTSEIILMKMCKRCDCVGSCVRQRFSCNESVNFDITSTTCANHCREHGRCNLMVGDSVLFAACVCSHKYRGWDCSDDSHTTPYNMIVMELLLLVLSNLAFLLTVFIACRRKYYIEAIVYFAIFFFSTFYHACDAGEDVISFCMTRLQVLQFADFYCALLSIWVTLIAIADLPPVWSAICHMTGAIVLSFTTSIEKKAMWGFAVPITIGIVIVVINWFLKWRKLRQMFLNKRYLYLYCPLGSVIVTLGLVIFIFLETAENYKYLHSMWHVLMAIAVIILLPTPNTFQKD